MSHQFGINWSAFSDLLTCDRSIDGLRSDVTFSGSWLQIMLFGMNRVGKGLHSRQPARLRLERRYLPPGFGREQPMHTRGLRNQQAGRSSRSTGLRLSSTPASLIAWSMTLAAYLTTAFVVGATGAWHLLRGSSPKTPRKCRAYYVDGDIVAPLQILAGDFHGLNTLEHQPMKWLLVAGWGTSERCAVYHHRLPGRRDRI